MLMRTMRRMVLVLVLLAAAAVAMEPVIHTHPLTEGASGKCAVCVNAHASVTALVPAAISPLTLVGEVPVVRLVAVSAHLPKSLTSRAPPAV